MIHIPSRLHPLQPRQNLLPHTPFRNNHLDNLGDHLPPHASPRRPPHSAPLILLPRGQHLARARRGRRARSGVDLARDARGREARGRVDGADRDDGEGAGGCGRGGDGEDGFGYGELVAGWVEEDVGAGGCDEEGYGWFLRGGGGLGGPGVEVCGGVPVVVEQGVFVALGEECGEPGVEEGEVGC